MIVCLALVAVLTLASCQYLIWVYAPVEAQMGLIQKIFYLHLPMSWWALLSFFVVFLASIAWLLRRQLWLDNLAAAAAELGLLFCSLALLSGMIWAKKSWGVWWTWDPRLTTTLVMCFLYATYALLRHMELLPTRRRVVCAVVGIVAFLDVPLVFFSARIFRSIHPAVFGQGGGLSPEMQFTAIACVVSVGFLWGALLLFRLRQLQMREWVSQLRQNILLEGNDNARI